MPELPEVETVRRSLAPIVGRRVQRVRLARRDIVITPDDPPGGLSRARSARPARQRPVPGAELLLGARIAELRRRGKQLALIADSGRAIVIQLGMTGRVTLSPAGNRRRQTAEPHTHIVWRLDDGSSFAFIDARRFGAVRTIEHVDELRDLWTALGPDAITIRADRLRPALARTDRPIKAALLDQQVLAGVGNIYADEALFACGIHPARPASTLEPAEVAALARAVRTTLRQAVEHRGSTLRDYRDASGAPGGFASRHAVYGRSGQPCARCARPLISGLLAQRTTVWCPACQPEISTRHPRPRSRVPGPHRGTHGSATNGSVSVVSI